MSGKANPSSVRDKQPEYVASNELAVISNSPILIKLEHPAKTESAAIPTSLPALFADLITPTSSRLEHPWNNVDIPIVDLL